jgi:hypothetical protein
MPDDYRKENDAQYDTGGDSFGQIFSDLFTGAAGAAMSGGVGAMGGGIFNEFLEFLEGGSGSGGFGGGGEDDADLRVLLQTGTLEQIAEEMDDTEMVVKQLEKKSRGLDDEIFAMDAEARMAAKFSEKIELEEKGASLKARKDVLNGYLNRARKRLLSLQTRYKDLIAYGGASDDYVGNSRGRSSWNDVKDEASTYAERPSSSSSSRGTSSYGSSSSYGETSSTSGAEGADSGSSDGDSWRNEGFGSSSGRSRRGSGRRRARSRSSRTSASSAGGVDSNPPRPSPSPSPSPSYSTTPNASGRDTASRQPPPPRTTTTPSPSPSTSSSSAVSKSNYSYDVPPHRRTTGSKSFASRQAEDQKRMQEIKVDEEFEKLKKELGL